MMTSLHIKGDGVVTLARIIRTLMVVIGLLAECALANLAATLSLRVGSDEAGLGRLLVMRSHRCLLIITYKLAILNR